MRRSLSVCTDGEQQLLQRLRCVPRMLAATNARIGSILNAADLEDVTQETIITVWRKRTEYDGRASIETWVYPFCYHHLMNRVRKHRRQPRSIEVASDRVVAPGPPGPRDVPGGPFGFNLTNANEIVFTP